MNPDDLLLPQWRSDPYPFYAALRAAGPVHWMKRLNAWVFTRYADVAAALRDSRMSSQRATAAFAGMPEILQEAAVPFKQSLNQWMLFRDPPDHTRIRGLCTKAFVPGLIETLRPKIQGIAAELLEGPTARGSLEVVSELAYPLPAIVIAEMIGVPPADRDKFKRFSDDLATLLAPGVKTPALIEQSLASWQDMEAYLIAMSAARRAAPRPDFLSALLGTEEQGNLLAEQEVRATVGLLLFGGHETTTNLITNGILLLLRHPEALTALRRDPALLPAAVEEMLRYEPPVQIITRILTEDVAMAGQTLRKGQRVLLSVASANRDPLQFPEPDRFLITRRDHRHLSLGLGLHFCLGASLARAEAQGTLALLLERWPNLHLRETAITWRDNLTLRCPQRLYITDSDPGALHGPRNGRND